MGRDRVDGVYKLIGSRIMEIRKSKEMSQALLATRCGLKRPSIALIEGGRQYIPLDGLFKVAKALNVEVAVFLPTVDEVFGQQGEDEGRDLVLDRPSRERITDEAQLQQIQSVLRKHEGTYEKQS